MRINELAQMKRLNENLHWDNEQSKDLFASLKGLVNKNNGIWKSKKQRDFLVNNVIKQSPYLWRDNGEFGVNDRESDGFVYLDATAQWAGYGSRSLVPVRWGFAMDDYGITSFWKIGNKGNLRDGSAPDPSKTKMEWQRSGDPDVSHLADTEEEKEEKFRVAMGASDGEHLGNVGDKKFEFGPVEVAATKEGFGDYGPYVWHLFKDANGNQITYSGKDLGVKRGETVNLMGTIKRHFENKKLQRVTSIIRPKVSVAESYKLIKVSLTEADMTGIGYIPEPMDKEAVTKHSFFIKKPNGETGFYTTDKDMSYNKAKEIAQRYAQGGEVHYATTRPGGIANPNDEKFKNWDGEERRSGERKGKEYRGKGDLLARLRAAQEEIAKGE